MVSDVAGLDEIDRTQVAAAGGKGANLGELLRIEGIGVPPGFCVTTSAFGRVVAASPSIAELIDRLAETDPATAGQTASQAVRAAVESIALPDDLVAAITAAHARLGEGVACAVRSSATAEDLPAASFAGQQDSYLNVIGAASVVDHVRRCWASLFTDRAIAYRHRQGIDHRRVEMAVVVQQQVLPDASGVLFTADPATGDRPVAVVEATLGLGEALVAGLVDPDSYRVRGGSVEARSIRAKRTAVDVAPAGGTVERAVPLDQQEQPALTDHQVLRLVELGHRIADHFGTPQDIEWCLVGERFEIVQSRPITTLFPVPASAADGQPHVYLSVGHQQMMTDAMKPLGLSVWQLIAQPQMHEAGGRLFVDVAPRLTSAAGRAALIDGFAKVDPLTSDALRTLVERGVVPDGDADEGPPPRLPGGPPSTIETDPAIVTELIEARAASLAELQQAIATRSGPAVLDFVLEDIGVLKAIAFEPRSQQVVMGGMEAAWWLDDHLGDWLGEAGAADVLAQSVPNNVTSEMGLALLDVADAIRPHPEVVALLERADGDAFLDELASVEGGAAALEAIGSFLDRYGMRCVGEIDITRPRWAERPHLLLPAILANVRTFEAGEASRRFEAGLQAARAKERDVLDRLRALPDGESKAREAKAMIDRVRTFAGYREHPKYVIVGRTFAYKQALWREAERLVGQGVIDEVDDISYLTFDELHDLVRAHAAPDAARAIIQQRKEAFRRNQALTPPRVLTGDGEAVTGSYRRDDLPPGALVGLAVSSGTVEGRARVVHDIADAALEPGDILVTPFTDPSWTPVFVAIAGLVTEVGGLMTHGAVIAREYGLPAVVAVDGATQRIRDGQRIRIDGARGSVELLG